MVASVNLLEQLRVADRLFYVSPSANSNSAGLSRLASPQGPLAPEDMYSNVNDVSILNDIVNKIEAERDDLEEYRKKLKLYVPGGGKQNQLPNSACPHPRGANDRVR